jgi:predicted O-methyltransferase YrrM
MNQDQWTAVDHYVTDLLLPPDPILDETTRAATEAGLPAIAVSPPLGRLLHLFAKMQGAKTILEVGTLAGYSTIWLARALPPGGRIITLEIDAKHAVVAQANFARAGLEKVIELRLGAASDTLPQLAAENRGPFDLVFIDADKAGIPGYFQWALRLTRRGSVIIVDNVVRKGAVIDAATEDPAVQGVRRFNILLAEEKTVTATTIQTVGSKGYDGFTLIYVERDPA